MLGSFVNKMVRGEWKQTQPIKFWDGRSAERIIEVLAELDIRKKDSRQIFSHG
jgi:hypothetical protein